MVDVDILNSDSLATVRTDLGCSNRFVHIYSPTYM